MEIVRFGSLYSIPTSNGVSRPSAVRGQGFHMINMGELFSYDIINEIPMDRVLLSEKEQEKYFVEKGDLLFARQSLVASGAGKCSIVNNIVEPTTFESHLIRVRLDDKKCCPLYYYYLFKLPYNPIKAIVNQCAQAGIRGSELQKIKVPLPSLNIQRRIASILSAYDNLIENNNKRIRLLEQMAENLYKEWFVRFRFPGHEKAEFENGLPKGWKYVTIKDICSVTDGVHNTIQDTPQSKYYLLSCKNIKDGKLVIGDNERTIDEDTFIKLRKRTQLAKGDILISSVGTIGETILLNEDPAYFEFQRSVAMIKPDKRYVNSNFMYEMLKSMRKELVNAAHGVAQQCLFIGDINKMRILLPAMNTIVTFEEKVQPIYDKILSLSKQSAILSRQRDLLLPRLMSGKLEVKV